MKPYVVPSQDAWVQQRSAPFASPSAMGAPASPSAMGAPASLHYPAVPSQQSAMVMKNAADKTARPSGSVRKRRREVTEVRGNWKPYEDETLRALVHAHGPREWKKLAASLPGRTGKQARERWINQLSPTVKKGGGWSEEEDKKVVLLQGQYGNKWSIIAGHLEGRTDNHVKNRFNSTLHRKTEEGYYDGWLEGQGFMRKAKAVGMGLLPSDAAHDTGIVATYEAPIGFAQNAPPAEFYHPSRHYAPSYQVSYQPASPVVYESDPFHVGARFKQDDVPLPLPPVSYISHPPSPPPPSLSTRCGMSSGPTSNDSRISVQNLLNS